MCSPDRYYIDDGWAADVKSNAHGPSECDGHWQADTGMTDQEVTDEIAAFRWVADKVYAAMLKAVSIQAIFIAILITSDMNEWIPKRWRCFRELPRAHCNATGAVHVHTRAMMY